MQNVRVIVQTPSIIRNFCTTSRVYANYIAREGKFLNKLIHGREKRKQYKYYNVKDTVSDSTLRGNTKRTPSVHVLRRMAILNKLFMEHITDLMTMGEVSTEIVGRNIEITDVKVTVDFKTVNVFWTSNDVTPDSNTTSTEEILKKCAISLRHELSQLRVISIVPLIQFVKCKRHSMQKEVERLLKIADYGEDFQPSPYPFSPNTTVTCISDKSEDTQEEENIKAKASSKKKTGTVNSDDTFFVTLPIMRHDVFGLDRYKIMTQIKVSLEKSRKGMDRRLSNALLESRIPKNLNEENSVNFRSKEEENQEFVNFLIQRKREERIKHRKISKRQQDRMNAISEAAYANGDDLDNSVDLGYFYDVEDNDE